MNNIIKNQIIINVKNDFMYCSTLIELCYQINNNTMLSNKLTKEEIETINKIKSFCKTEIGRIDLALRHFKEYMNDKIKITDIEFQNLSKHSFILRSELKQYFLTLKLISKT